MLNISTIRKAWDLLRYKPKSEERDEHYFYCCRQRRGGTYNKKYGYDFTCDQCGYRETLLPDKYGNMISLGAVLVDVEVKVDPLINNIGCPTDCRICIEECPQKALDGATVDQKLCRPLSTFKTEKGYTLLKCSLCRQICPKRLGFGKG